MFANLLMDRSDNLITYAELKRETNRDKYNKVRVASILNGLYKLDDRTNDRVVQFIYDAITNYPIEGLNAESRDHFCKALRYSSWGTALYEFVETNWTAIINGLFLTCVREEDFEEVKELFDEYGQDYSAFIGKQDNAELLADCLRDLADGQTSNWIQDDRLSILSAADWGKLKKEITKKRQSIFETFKLEDEWYDEESFFADMDVEDLIETNKIRKKESKKDQLNNTQKFESTQDEDLVKEIELLFCGEYDNEFVKMKAEEIGLPF